MPAAAAVVQVQALGQSREDMGASQGADSASAAARVRSIKRENSLKQAKRGAGAASASAAQAGSNTGGGEGGGGCHGGGAPVVYEG